MKSRKKYDAVATVGTYKDKQTGEEKKRYANVGTVFESEDGRLSLKLDTIPVGPGWSGYISFYVPNGRDDQSPQRQALPDGRNQQRSMPPAPEKAPDGDEDNIPF